MSSLDQCWPAVQRALTICRAAPERFQTHAAFCSVRDVQPTLDEVRQGLDAVEQVLLTLGPQEAGEPTTARFPEMTPLAERLNGEIFEEEVPDPSKLRQVFERWSSRHGVAEILPGGSVTWGGLARLWTRACVGHIAEDITRAISRVRPDPGGGRQHFIDRVPEMIWLLEDSPRAMWIGAYIAILQDDCMPLTTELYHHPTSGDGTRSTIEHSVLPEDMVYILAHPPKTHRVPPWRPPR